MSEEAQIPEEVRILSTSENIMFNLPNFSVQSQYSVLTNFLLIFYINILGQPPLIIGGIYSLTVYLGALLSPIWGALCTRFSTKVGRKKTLMIFSAPMLMIIFVLLWIPPIPTTPFGVSFLPLIVYLAILLTLYTFFSSGYYTSYLSMIPELSTEETNRVKISIMNMLGTIGGAFIGMLVPLLLLQNSTEGLSRDDPDLFFSSSPQGQEIYRGVFLFSIFISLGFAAAFLLMMIKIREPDVPVDKEFNLKKIFSDIIGPFRDKNFRLYIFSFFLMFITATIFQVIIFGFLTFVLALRGNEFLLVGGVGLGAAILSFLISERLTEKVGLKRSMILYLILGVLSFCSTLILLIPFPHKVNLIIGIIILAFWIISFIGVMIYPMAIVSEMVDHAQKSTKNNLSGSYLGSTNMISSLAAASSLLFTSILLQVFGAETEFSYVFLFFLGGICFLISLLFFRKVKLKS